jgi:predicted DNA-binding protein
MIRTQIQLSEEQARKLRRAARVQGVSMAEMVRRCIEQGLEDTTAHAARYARAASIVGKFSERGDDKDVSSRHDAYLDEAFG